MRLRIGGPERRTDRHGAVRDRGHGSDSRVADRGRPKIADRYGRLGALGNGAPHLLGSRHPRRRCLTPSAGCAAGRGRRGPHLPPPLPTRRRGTVACSRSGRRSIRRHGAAPPRDGGEGLVRPAHQRRAVAERSVRGRRPGAELTLHRPPGAASPSMLVPVKVLVDGAESPLHLHDGSDLQVGSERLASRLGACTTELADMLQTDSSGVAGRRVNIIAQGVRAPPARFLLAQRAKVPRRGTRSLTRSAGRSQR